MDPLLRPFTVLAPIFASAAERASRRPAPVTPTERSVRNANPRCSHEGNRGSREEKSIDWAFDTIRFT
jgi:hypothetical protein